MVILAGIVLFALFFMGFPYFDKLHKANELKGSNMVTLNSTEEIVEYDALIYGNMKFVTEISAALNDLGISSDSVHDINKIDMSRSYNYLVAAGCSDLDNLTVCAMGIKMMDIKKVLAVCNQPHNRKIYEENLIPVIFSGDISASEIALTLLKYS